MSICIADATLIADWQAPPRHASVLVEDGRIAATAERDDERAALAARARATVAADGLTLIPGFVNAHHHAYANVLRGTENRSPLELWALHTVAWGRALDAAALRVAALMGAAEMLRAGVTGCIDHFPHLRHARAMLAAHREGGMRIGFAPFLHDIHDHDFLALDLDESTRARLGGPFFPADAIAPLFRALAAEAAGSRVRLLLGPNAPQRCSPALLALWRRLREELAIGVHTHLLETWPQAARARELWAGGLVGEMERAGLLDRGLSVAHGIWLMESERAALARHGVSVVHNPASNVMLGSGLCRLADYRARGVALALGSDSANTGGRADPFALMRLAMMLPRLSGAHWRDWPGERDAFRMATEGGAAILGLPGRIEAGAPADLVLLDLHGAAQAAMAPGIDALVQHGGPDCVRATMIAGEWVYREGMVLAFDEAAVLRDFAALAPAMRAAAAPALDAARALTPAVDAALTRFLARHPRP